MTTLAELHDRVERILADDQCSTVGCYDKQSKTVRFRNESEFAGETKVNHVEVSYCDYHAEQQIRLAEYAYEIDADARDERGSA